jgi:hypothetical protein
VNKVASAGWRCRICSKRKSTKAGMVNARVVDGKSEVKQMR